MLRIHMDILELGDLVPQHKPIRLNRKISQELVGPEGAKTITYKTEPIVLQAYLYGPRCPVVIKSKLRQVWEAYSKTVQESGYSDEAFQVYARDSFIALIPGIEFDEADVLASDDDTANGMCVKTLKYLNYWRGGTDDQEEQTADPEAKAETEQSTTQESSPISA